MSHRIVLKYFQCIEPLMAEEALHSLGVSAYPHMKREAARNYEKKLKSASRANLKKNNAPQNTEQLYHHLLRTLGNG